MATRELRVLITGDPKGLSRALGQADRQVGVTEGRIHRSSRRMATSFKVAGAAAGAALVVGLKKSTDAAIEAEKAQARMTTQLRAAGINYAQHRVEIDRVIQSHSRLSGI